MGKSKLYIIAGPNGSGKTTFAERFLPGYVSCFEFINADLIAKGLSPFNSSRMAIKAGKILLEQIEDCARRKIDFAFETTLAGRNYLKTFQRIKKRGYELHLFFLWIPSVNLALARVADRVKKGGHPIPGPDVKRRFVRGLRNLFGHYRNAFDTWSVFDNATGKPRQVFKVERNTTTIMDRVKYQSILKQAGYEKEN